MTRPALLIRTGALGDFVLSLSVVEALRAAGYGPITLIGRDEFVRLAREAGVVDVALDFDSDVATDLFHEDDTTQAVRDLVAGQELVLYWGIADPGNPLDRNLRAATDARIVRMDPHPRDNWPGHVTKQWFHDLREAGLALEPAPPRLALPNLPGPGVDLVVHPGSGSEKKCWDMADFSLVALDFTENATACFVLGPVEAERWSHRMDRSLGETGKVYRNLGLKDLCRILASARCYLGNDSGPTHLAAALGVPVVAVFGPATKPRQWRPLGERVTVLGHPEWPGQEEVLEAVRACAG